mmetsp:Transcript_9516/g.27313  ORF Transcript_9516/g.27313 Transcript_9516/m.27313 type:complete len:222 (+) Transcript_9516:153-818(+)
MREPSAVGIAIRRMLSCVGASSMGVATMDDHASLCIMLPMFLVLSLRKGIALGAANAGIPTTRTRLPAECMRTVAGPRALQGQRGQATTVPSTGTSTKPLTSGPKTETKSTTLGLSASGTSVGMLMTSVFRIGKIGAIINQKARQPPTTLGRPALQSRRIFADGGPRKAEKANATLPTTLCRRHHLDLHGLTRTCRGIAKAMAIRFQMIPKTMRRRDSCHG